MFAVLRNCLTSSLRRFLFYLILAGGLTWPLSTHLTSHLPLGTEQVASVPLFNLWTLRWNVERLSVGYAGYWDAPIFYPETGTFALSEPQLLIGMLSAPVYFLSGNPVLAYNMVLLLLLALNGTTASQLLSKLGLATNAALLGGMLAVSLPFVFNELGVLQLTVLFPIFLCFSSLLEFAQSTSLRAALSLGAWLAVTYLISGYYGLFLSIFLIVAGLVFLQRDHLRPRPVRNLLMGVLLAGVLLLPFAATQARLINEYRRSTSTIQRNSAQGVDYLRLRSSAWGHAWMPWLQSEGGSGQRLYPGSALLLLAGLGLVHNWRKRNNRRWILYCSLGIALAVLFSLGLNVKFGEWQPYTLLKDHYPGFQLLRSPFRLAVFVQIFLVGLAGFGLNALWQWRAKLGPWLAVAAVAIGMGEVAMLPARLYAVPESVSQADWIDWLDSQPQGPVAMVPFATGSRASDFELTVIAMLQGLEHGKPLLNGFSGFFPQSYRRLRTLMTNFPNENSLALLREAGAVYIVIDKDWLTARRLFQLEARQRQLSLDFSGETKSIYQLVPVE